MKMDLPNELKCIENKNLSAIFAKLYALKLERDSEILELRNKVTNSEERITEQEIYSSKETIIIENVPIKTVRNHNQNRYVSSLKNFWATKHSRVGLKHVFSWDRAQATNQRLST